MGIEGGRRRRRRRRTRIQSESRNQEIAGGSARSKDNNGMGHQGRKKLKHRTQGFSKKRAAIE